MWALNQHITKISKQSWDTEYWNNEKPLFSNPLFKAPDKHSLLFFYSINLFSFYVL